jgi:hypothetical protein
LRESVESTTQGCDGWNSKGNLENIREKIFDDRERRQRKQKLGKETNQLETLRQGGSDKEIFFLKQIKKF